MKLTIAQATPRIIPAVAIMYRYTNTGRRTARSSVTGVPSKGLITVNHNRKINSDKQW